MQRHNVVLPVLAAPLSIAGGGRQQDAEAHGPERLEKGQVPWVPKSKSLHSRRN